MNFKISKEQNKFCEEIMFFARTHLNREEDLTEFSKTMWESVADFGLFGLSVPEEYGGLGESYLTAALAMEALGYACHNNGFIFAVANHMWVGLNLILLYGSSEQKARYLSPMIEGRWIGAMAISEADAGSDANAMLTTAVLNGEDFIINGSKVFISNGTIADVLIVFANCIDNGRKQVAAFIIDKKNKGVHIGADIKKMGLESCPMAEISFTDCRVSKNALLASVTIGDSIMKSALEWERCYEFASHLGTMRRIMEMCLKHAQERKQFGKPLSEYQAVTHKISDMKVSIEMARRMMYDIACRKDLRKNAFLEASIFKLYTSEAYIKTCRDAMQIFGAYGYTKEYGLEREMRDALACSIYSGTNEMQRNTIYTFATLGE